MTIAKAITKTLDISVEDVRIDLTQQITDLQEAVANNLENKLEN